MLSHCLRDMRTELEKVAFQSGDIVQFSAADIKDYIQALTTYERMVREMEKQLAEPKPAPVSSLCEIVTFPTRVPNVSQPAVMNGDGGDAA